MDKSKMGKYSMMRQDKMKSSTMDGGEKNYGNPGAAAEQMKYNQNQASGVGAYNNVIGKYENNSGIGRMLSNLGQTKKAEEEITPQEARSRNIELRRQMIENVKDERARKEQARKDYSEYSRSVTKENLDRVVPGQKDPTTGLYPTKKKKEKESKRRNPAKPTGKGAPKSKTAQKSKVGRNKPTRAEKKKGLSSTKKEELKQKKRRNPANPQGK